MVKCSVYSGPCCHGWDDRGPMARATFAALALRAKVAQSVEVLECSGPWTLLRSRLYAIANPNARHFAISRARSTLSGGRFSGGTGVRYRCRGSRLSTWKCRPTYCRRPSAWPWGSGDLGFRLCDSQSLWLENSVEIWLANLPALALASQASIRCSRLLPCLLWNWGLYKELANGSSTPAFHRSWIDCQESIFPHGWQGRFMSFTCISRHPGHCMDPFFPVYDVETEGLVMQAEQRTTLMDLVLADASHPLPLVAARLSAASQLSMHLPEPSAPEAPVSPK